MAATASCSAQVGVGFHAGTRTLFEPIFVQVVLDAEASPPGQS